MPSQLRQAAQHGKMRGGAWYCAPSILREALLRALAASFLSLALGVTRAARFRAAARCSSAVGTIGSAWKAPVFFFLFACGHLSTGCSSQCSSHSWLRFFECTVRA